jgi:hypothetical protein
VQRRPGCDLGDHVVGVGFASLGRMIHPVWVTIVATTRAMMVFWPIE